MAALLGACPFALQADDPAASPAPVEIRTPPAPATPRINGPRVYGARPGHPFFYHLPVTGEGPLTFTSKGLPAGLKLDPATGNVTGTATEPGTHAVEFTAANARGTDRATVSVVIGDTICLTPPLGWNSWNHFGNKVTGADVRAAADAMVASGLIDHGWTYINIDDCWQGERDADGNLHGNSKFPDLKALGEYIHGKGLKFGIYSSPGPKTCAGYAGSYQHARTYAEWGVDYVKFDMCSYGTVARNRLRDREAALLPAEQQTVYLALCAEQDALRKQGKRTPEQDARIKEIDTDLGKLPAPYDAIKKPFYLEEEQTPYRVFGQSLAKVPRDIVYSFCQYGFANVWEWAPTFGGNCWRTTGDIQANWSSMSGIGFKQDRLTKFAEPGHWNDPDMLEIGNAGLNPDECYTHMTLWCMLSAPLLIGCDLSKMDPLTVSMFFNDEVLAVDQDELGQQAHRLKVDGSTEVWVKELADESLVVALFNRGDQPNEISVSWRELFDVNPAQSRFLHIQARPENSRARDLWRQKDLPRDFLPLKMTVSPHGTELMRVRLNGKGTPGT